MQNVFEVKEQTGNYKLLAYTDIPNEYKSMSLEYVDIIIINDKKYIIDSIAVVLDKGITLFTLKETTYSEYEEIYNRLKKYEFI